MTARGPRHGARTLGLLCLLPWACAERESKPAPDAPRTAAPAHGVSPVAPSPSPDARLGTSIYHLELALVDQEGHSLGLDAFRGHPVLVSLFYSSCTSMCPLLITHLQRIEQALPPEVRAVTRILLVSLDPARDTPDKLKLLAAEHGIDTARWSLTRTPEASVRQLAAVLNVRYRRVPTGEIAHSSIITALDAQGVPTLRVEDASGDPGELVRALSHAATGLAHSGD